MFDNMCNFAKFFKKKRILHNSIAVANQRCNTMHAIAKVMQRFLNRIYNST